MQSRILPKPKMPPKEYWNDDKWASKNLIELTRQYPDMWITVVDKKVVAFGKDPEKVMNKTKRKTRREEFPILFIEKGVRVYQDKSNY